MRIADFAGSHAKGTLQIGQQSINQLLALEAKKTAPSVELLAHNQVVMRYGLIQARAELLPVPTGRASPTNITLRLASTVVAMALNTFVRQPFVHLNGRDLTIMLAAIPALRPWQRELRYLKHLELSTSPGVLHLQFVAAITE